MNQIARTLIRTAFAGYTEMLMMLPLLLLIRIYSFPEDMFWVWLAGLGLLYPIGYLLRSAQWLSRLIVRHLVIAALSLLYSGLWFSDWQSLIIGVSVAWLACGRGGKYAVHAWRNVLHSALCVIGIALYFFMSVIARLIEQLHPLVEPLGWFGLLALVITLFLSNRSMLDKESMSCEDQQMIGRSVLWKNRVLILIFGVIVGVIFAFDAIRHAAFLALRAIVAFVLWFLSLFRWQEAAVEKPPAPPPNQLPIEEQPEPALFWVILEQIAFWAFVAVLIAGAMYTLYNLLRKIPGWMKSLYTWLMTKLQFDEHTEAGQGYEDEVERLGDWDQMRDDWLQRLRAMFARQQEEKWQRLTNNIDRIRFLYRTKLSRLIENGYRYRASLTPRETKADADRWSGREAMPAELVHIYEAARYGGKAPDDAELEALRKKLDREREE